MRDDTLLIKVLGGSPKMRIIDFFIDERSFDFTKKEVIEELGMSNTTFYKYFPDIVDMRLVKPTRRIGRAQLYSLNEESGAVGKLVELEDELSELVRQRQLNKDNGGE